VALPVVVSWCLLFMPSCQDSAVHEAWLSRPKFHFDLKADAQLLALVLLVELQNAVELFALQASHLLQAGWIIALLLC
jgi:hypothetical protein